MQNVLDEFASEVRKRRKKLHYTQKQLAEKLHMSSRTIIDLENCRSNPRFETIAYIAQELDISLDALLFPHTATATVPKSVADYFSGMSESEVQKYIVLCQHADTFRTEKVEATV